MKTDDLIDMLARGAGEAPPWQVAPKLLTAALMGLVAAAFLSVVVIGPIPAALYATPAPWIKLAYGVGLALAAGWLVARRARPLSRLTAARGAVLVVLVAMAVVGATTLMNAPAEQRMPQLMGHSWKTCPFNLFALSLPGLAATLWVMRDLAPGSPRAAGLAAGLMAGAVGAVGYSLACGQRSRQQEEGEPSDQGKRHRTSGSLKSKHASFETPQKQCGPRTLACSHASAGDARPNYSFGHLKRD